MQRSRESSSGVTNGPRPPVPSAPIYTGAPTGAPRRTAAPVPAGARPTGAPRPMTGAPERQLPLSGMIRNTLTLVAEREQQRKRLITVLVAAQFLLTLAIGAGYIGPRPATSVLAALIVALVVYAAAYVTNRFLNNSATASYILVFGGGLAYAAQVLLSAASGNAGETAQATLFLLAVMLEAGLLFAPEVTLITAALSTTLTAAALLFAVAVGPTLPRREIYLLVVYTVSLQALLGLIAWLISQFIFESAFEAQRAQELQFSQARLDALMTQTHEQHARLEADIASLQAIVTRALGGEYTARVELPGSDLAALASSLNLLLERVESATQADQMRQRMEAAALPLIEAMGRISEANTPTPSSLPIMTNTPLDSVSVALTQMHNAMTRRLARVQALAGEVAGALDHSRDGLTSTNDEIVKAQRIAGALIALSDSYTTNLQKQVELLGRARRMLTALLPAEITQQPLADDAHREASALDPTEAAQLMGLGADVGLVAGYTGEFTTLQPALSQDAGIAPLTIPLPIVNPDASPAAAHEAGGDTPASLATDAEMAVTEALGEVRSHEIPAELVEVWRLMGEIGEEVATEERTISTLAHELGVLSRAVRQADVGIAWVMQALDALRRDTEQLQQAAGTNAPLPEPAEMSGSTPSRPIPQPGTPPRTPQLTRPLSGEAGPGGETLAELADALSGGDAPAPGTLRAADLLSSDALPGSPASEPQSGPSWSTDR